jgi:hypothetical protein
LPLALRLPPSSCNMHRASQQGHVAQSIVRAAWIAITLLGWPSFDRGPKEVTARTSFGLALADQIDAAFAVASCDLLELRQICSNFVRFRKKPNVLSIPGAVLLSGRFPVACHSSCGALTVTCHTDASSSQGPEPVLRRAQNGSALSTSLSLSPSEGPLSVL